MAVLADVVFALGIAATLTARLVLGKEFRFRHTELLTVLPLGTAAILVSLAAFIWAVARGEQPSHVLLTVPLAVQIAFLLCSAIWANDRLQDADALRLFDGQFPQLGVFFFVVPGVSFFLGALLFGYPEWNYVTAGALLILGAISIGIERSSSYRSYVGGVIAIAMVETAYFYSLALLEFEDPSLATIAALVTNKIGLVTSALIVALLGGLRLGVLSQATVKRMVKVVVATYALTFAYLHPEASALVEPARKLVFSYVTLSANAGAAVLVAVGLVRASSAHALRSR